MRQICPSENPFKRSYVRIKTFDGKYWHAVPSKSCKTREEYLCVKTRCCGSKSSVGQRDITEPGRRTTFKVHCADNMGVAMFELLNYNVRRLTAYTLAMHSCHFTFHYIKPLSPNIHIQILQTDLNTFPQGIGWEKLIKDQSIFTWRSFN